MRTDTTRPERSDSFGLITFIVGFAASGVLVGVSMVSFDRHYDATMEAKRAARAELVRAACEERGALFVSTVEGVLPVSDPLSEKWSAAPALDVPLQKQTIAMPMLETLTVESVRIQGLTDGDKIAWRLSWLDDTVDANVDTGRFSDAVALQFPMVRNAKFSMGERGQRVQILHWKALWQKDVDEHFQDVQDLHPNYWADLYWFAEGRPYIVPASFSDPRSHAWFAAYSAGNPMSDIHRTLPVEELIAEGYGTLTSQRQSVTIGKGAWNDGEWSVVLARPMRTDDDLDFQFRRSSRNSVGIAVWDGSAENVGGRKHWTNWIPYEVSP